MHRTISQTFNNNFFSKTGAGAATHFYALLCLLVHFKLTVFPQLKVFIGDLLFRVNEHNYSANVDAVCFCLNEYAFWAIGSGFCDFDHLT